MGPGQFRQSQAFRAENLKKVKSAELFSVFDMNHGRSGQPLEMIEQSYHKRVFGQSANGMFFNCFNELDRCLLLRELLNLFIPQERDGRNKLPC